MKKKAYIGIDLGKDGALCIITADQYCAVVQTPLIGDTVDNFKIHEILRDWKEVYDCQACFETIFAIPGKCSSKTLKTCATNSGIVQGILIALEIPFQEIQAKKWQKRMFEGLSESLKGDTKSSSLLVARKLYPGDWWNRTKSKSKLSGISDAILIAEDLRRRMK